MNFLLFICLLLAATCRAQTDSGKGPALFSSGFIDVISNGQVHAAARLLKVHIGEPGKWTLPLSLYSGVSANNFQNAYPAAGTRSNDHLPNQLINPLSGMVNVSVEGTRKLFHNGLHTQWGLLWQAGERLLTGYRMGGLTDPTTGKPVHFLSAFATAGVYFQTAARERSGGGKTGIFWLSARYIGSANPASTLRNIIPGIQTNGIYTGYAFGWGMEIIQLVQIRMVYYKYLKAPELDYGRSVYQFSFQYAWKP